LNVLEHVPDESSALASIARSLQQNGRAIILVPQNPKLYGALDEALGHVRRYTRETLSAALDAAGFELETVFDFNRPTTPGWWWNGKVMRRRHFGKLQLKILNLSVWLMRPLDRVLPWHGASLIAVARKR